MIGTTIDDSARKGKLLRDKGIKRAARKHGEQIDRDELRFLDALAINGEETLDSAVDDLATKFRDGGRWRGSIPLRLARQGLIVAVGYRKSSRTHRHAGPVRVWAILDRTAVDARRSALRQKFLILDSTNEKTVSTTGIVETVENTHTAKGSTSDGQVI